MIKGLLASTALALVLTLPALAQTSTTTTTDTQNQTTTVPTTQSGQSATGSTAQPSTTGGAATGSTTAQTGESSGSSSSTSTMSNESSSTGQTAVGEEAIINEQQPGQVRADKVIGAKVTSPAGEKVGNVSDILLDEQGKVVGVILSVGGFLGIGDKQVAVNWMDIKLADDGDSVLVNMSKDQIKNAPSFKTAEDLKREQQAETPPAAPATTGTTGSSATGSTTSGSSTTQ